MSKVIAQRPTPRWTTLRAHEAQQRYFRSESRFNVVPAGRRCLEAGTLVATPTGPIPIEELQVGDTVLGFEYGQIIPTTVSAVWDNGRQLVHPIGSGNRTYLAGTAKHKLWACDERRCSEADYRRMELSALDKWHRVRRCYADALIVGGSIHQDRTYSLAAMLGNGCCREGKTVDGSKSKHLYISSPDDCVPKRMALELGCSIEKRNADNYTWKLEGAFGSIPYFDDWCSMRYSYEKQADWSIVNGWDRESCLMFLAGIFDTDTSLYIKENHTAAIQIAMQAKSVVEVCRDIIFKYFQEYRPITIDDREKYVHGPCYCLNITDNLLCSRIIAALGPYMVKALDMSACSMRNHKPDRIGLHPIGQPYEADTYDITVSNSTNLYVLHNGGIVTSNSGKTEVAKRRLVRRAIARCIYGHPIYHNGRFFVAAPTRDQAKRIYWQDLKAFIPKQYFGAKPKETDLIITLKNNVEIHVIGMDKPERFEGSPWDGGILDEYGNMKAQAWMENIFPALADRKGWADLIGVPEGRNHYYDRWLEALACTDGTIAPHHWRSSEILPPEEIALARRMLDELSFKQEFDAEFVNFAGQCYYPFSTQEHCSSLTYDPSAPLIFCFDFNVSPGVAAVIQEQVIPGSFELAPKPEYGRGRAALTVALKIGPDAMMQVPVIGTGIIGEVYIKSNSNTPAVCRKLIQDWGDHQGIIRLYGDASGGSRGSAKVDGSDWDLIWSMMCDHYGESRVYMEVPQANPMERVRINAVNARLKSLDGTIRMKVDPEHCTNVIRDFEGVRLLEGGSGEIDKRRDPMLSHMCFVADTKISVSGFETHDIAHISTDGEIFSWDGMVHKYVQAGLTIQNAPVVSITLSNGKKITQTPNHRYLTENGWECAKNLCGSILVTVYTLRSAILKSSYFNSWINLYNVHKIVPLLIEAVSSSLYDFVIGSKIRINMIPTCTIETIVQSAIRNCCDVRKVQKRIIKQSIGFFAKKSSSREDATRIAVGELTKLSEFSREDATRIAVGELTKLSLIGADPSELGGVTPYGSPLTVQKVEDAGLSDVYCLKVPVQGCFCLEDGIIVSNSDAIGYYVAREFPVIDDSYGNIHVGGRF